MGLISKPYTWSSGAVIVASEHNSNFDTLFNCINGSLSTANLASNAAIVDTQLAQITTAGKVSTTALTIASQATGDLIYASASNTWARLGIGTSSQGLIGGTIPAWSSTSPFTGSTAQVINTTSVAATTGSTVIPFDDTIPVAASEGNVLTALDTAITGKSASNKWKIDVSLQLSDGISGVHILAAYLTLDSGNAIAIGYQTATTAEVGRNVSFTYYMAVPDTNAHTFHVYYGSDAAGTVTVNGLSASRKFGGVMGSSITVTEIKG